jgi:hypothetical protein
MVIVVRITSGSNRLRAAVTTFAGAKDRAGTLSGPLRGRGFRPPAPGRARCSSACYTDRATAA